MYTRFNTFLWTLSFKRCVSNFKTNSYLRTKGRFRSGPRGPWPLLLSGKLFSFVNVCRGWYFELCYLNIFSLINRALLIRKESVFEAIFSRKWPKLPECMQYYSSPRQDLTFFRETMLPPLPGGCALPAITCAPASIIKCYITSLTTTTPVVY